MPPYPITLNRGPKGLPTSAGDSHLLCVKSTVPASGVKKNLAAWRLPRLLAAGKRSEPRQGTVLRVFE